MTSAREEHLRRVREGFRVHTVVRLQTRLLEAFQRVSAECGPERQQLAACCHLVLASGRALATILIIRLRMQRQPFAEGSDGFT